MSLASMIGTGELKVGATGADVLALQIALSQAGYRVGQDSDFGAGTERMVYRFQKQHGIIPDGIVGALTAHLLDAPGEVLVHTATPTIHDSSGFPHDDTASLLAFYGKPWEDSSLLTDVPVPFDMTFREDNGTLIPIKNINFNVKAAKQLSSVLIAISLLAKATPDVLVHVKNFSGSYNYRPVRGSSRLSCHAFGAAIDFDAENLPMGTRFASSVMPQSVVDAFKSQGFYWGGDFKGRPDAMHFQSAHE